MRALDFYREKLGFICLRLAAPPAFAVLDRDGFSLYLEEADAGVSVSPSGGWDLHLRVDDLFAELAALRGLDIPIAFGPVDFVDGPRKRIYFEVEDPDGYRVCIEQYSWLTSSEREGGHSPF